MHAVRIWPVAIAAFLAGCIDKPPQPTSAVPAAPAAVVQEDYLAGIVTATPPETPETLAAKRARLEANLKLAQESADGGDLDQAIGLLEDAVMLDPKHRTVLLLLTQYLHQRSLALEEEDPRRAFGLMRQSGGYLRMLRDAHDDFSAEEREQFANVLFDEACAFARANRQEDFSGSLSAAIEAGFDDLARLETEPDLSQFRRDEKMSAILKDAQRRIESHIESGTARRSP
ncbi:MAG: hypothetical protein L0211_07415 [Planctomycetaceae bacterium]|nr:hypothetical protein [Planctomycetaceae bacterium]